MVDRGGLNYPIRVRDEFSKQTQLFRQEMRESKKAYRDFRREVTSQRGVANSLRASAKSSSDLARSQRDVSKESAKSTKPLTEQEQILKELARLQKEQRDREREAVRIRNAQAADARRRRAEQRQQEAARAKALRDEERAQRAIEKAERDRIRQEQKALKAAEQAEKQRERTAQRIAKQQRADEARRDREIEKERKLRERFNPTVQAEKQINRELFEREVQLRKIELLRERGKKQIARGDVASGRATLRQAKELEESLERSNKSANGLLFTFRRLVGVLAIFTLARRGVQAFNDLVAAGLRFNDTIESSTIGIAGLVATLGDVRNSLGQSVGASEELDLSLGLAREQIQLLRQDSLRTVATFEQLLDTFQVAVGPGLAAGLNLDEVRQLTVDISQAASALGVPQNQLAEEVRSLLSGTIQARTTRIATALGITNADIRQLRETGELFDFLEKEFEGFDEAARRTARSTLSGIRTLVQGAFTELLGQSAQPLFDELLSLGNQLFDRVITITDAAGNIRPNPEAVKAFRTLFEALRDGVRSARDFGQSLGFEGLQNLVGTIATGLSTGLQIAIGFGKVLFTTLSAVISVIRRISELLGISLQTVGGLAAAFGQVLAGFVIFRQLLRLVGLDFTKVLAVVKTIGNTLRAVAVGPVGLLAAGIATVLLGFNKLFDAIFGIDVGIRDTIQLIALGLAGAFIKVVEIVKTVGLAVSNGVSEALDQVISKAKRVALRGRGFVAALFGDDERAQELATQELQEQLRQSQETAARRTKYEQNLALIRQDAAAAQKALEQEINDIIGERAGEQARGGAFDPTIDPTKFDEAAEAAQTFVSTADKPINELSEGLLKVNDELRRARTEFDQAANSAGAGGFAGAVEGLFAEQEIANAERLRQISTELANTQEKINALRAAGTPETSGELVSLLRDEKDLRDAINQATGLSEELAIARAATEARRMLPALAQENALLQSQVAQQRAITSARLNDASARDQAILAAQAALDTARLEAEQARQRADAELALLNARAQAAPAGAERDAIQASIDALTDKRDLESEIAQLKELQLQKELEQANLVANGSFAQGARQGLVDLANELPTIFEVGLNLAKGFVTDFASFAASSIVDTIVNSMKQGVDESELFEQAAGQFAQQLATQILEQVIQNLIGTLLQNLLGQQAIEITTATTTAGIKVAAAQTAAGIEIAAAQTAAAIRAGVGFGFHSGGLVKGYNRGGKVQRAGQTASRAHAFARGFNLGGSMRPPGLHPKDTVPAWLQPGEFVIRKAVVDAVGLNQLQALNGGGMSIIGSASAESASPSTGMRSGGLVSDRLAASAGQRESGGSPVQVLPAIAADDATMDRLVNGGENAYYRFNRENAANMNSLFDKGARKR